MSYIGFSTGALAKITQVVEKRIAKLLHLEMNAIEIILAKPEFIINFNPTDIKKLLRDIEYTSIHSVFRVAKEGYDGEVVKKLSEIVSVLDAKGVVFHPGSEDDYTLLENSGFPIYIENMDASKPFGKSVKYFLDLKQKYPAFDFVLDVQHAFLNDPTMTLATEFIDTLGSKISYMHLSECDNNLKHIPLYHKPNQPIAEFLRRNTKVKQVPWLDEGAVERELELKTELDFIRNLNQQI